MVPITSKHDGELERPRATNQKCSYYKDLGHVTEDCYEFKKSFDEKVAKVHE